MMKRTPPSTPTLNNIIRAPIINTIPIESTPNDKKRKLENEMSSNSESETKSSEMMMQQLAELKLQLNNLNDTINSLNAIINDLRNENKELKQIIQNQIPNDATEKSHRAQHINVKKDTHAQSSNSNNNANGSGSGTDGNGDRIDNGDSSMLINDGEISFEFERDRKKDDGFVHETSITFEPALDDDNNDFVTKRNKKIPPVDIWSENTKAIQKKLNDTFPRGSLIFWRINKSKFRVFPKTIEFREKLIEYLSKRGIHFNTYKQQDEKLINILIKNTDIDEAELIRSELNSIGIEPHTIKRYETGYMRKNSIESKIWHLILHPNTDTKSLFNKKNIGAHIVKYEFLKKPTITQCKRCQRFNHSASSCHLPYRCVKCSNQHEPGQCPLNTSKNKTKLKCANCGGAHTANDAKQCPAFNKAIQIKETRKKENTKRNTVPNNIQNSNTQTSTASLQTKQMSDLFKATRTHTNVNRTSNTASAQVSVYMEQQQRMMTEFLNAMMKTQNDFIQRLFNG